MVVALVSAPGGHAVSQGYKALRRSFGHVLLRIHRMLISVTAEQLQLLRSQQQCVDSAAKSQCRAQTPNKPAGKPLHAYQPMGGTYCLLS